MLFRKSCISHKITTFVAASISLVEFSRWNETLAPSFDTQEA